MQSNSKKKYLDLYLDIEFFEIYSVVQTFQYNYCK
jgi:hypothetical protein